MNSTSYANNPPISSAPPTSAEAAQDSVRRALLLDLLRRLDADGYDFVAPTPATHRRVVRRTDRQLARSITDVLGWSLPVPPGLLDGAVEQALLDAGVLEPRDDGLLQPALRVSRVESALFWHSAYPTIAPDSVFLGPDSYRFAQLILAEMPDNPQMILDYGAGAGVGGITAARRSNDALLTIADINPKALFLASINAEHAGVRHQLIEVSRPRDIAGSFDLIVTHPPFMMDAGGRTYRDGGDLYGSQLSLEWALDCAELLGPEGWFVMHTGAPIVRGEDLLLRALRQKLPLRDVSLSYRELDPDIFGNVLGSDAYADVDRIAAVGAVIEREPA